ncbi:efflux RND transporter periplasmic adaptor subunit [Halomonas sp. ISL-106]|uniref:efflux RND transporter periplasmic adaptor subunit n=1 Tax=Halomonas sp. ALS9 TaxID=1805819 RepID=UPI0007DA1A4A|nr:efflux RND transporter periplasmic adaptor subunit [Halomonas sp. ALS9]MBT2788772.1 efflux RND transporter periplasmic adaptor subunit [Halomonas sp. ISL-106]MBT2799491.1 efflux RND transporter periplasmic adaptor subunit [Halomonas sp. ISL-104]OAL60484.1 efflux transporter periplasmic adaptor subunit [Halomonas sp. ALS9]
MPLSPTLARLGAGVVLIITLMLSLVATALAQQSRVETKVVEDTPRVDVLPLTGSVSAPQTSQLSSAEEGQVIELTAEIGDRVTQGQSLLSLDTRDITLESQRARADLAQAEVDRNEAQRLVSEANQLSAQNFAASERRQRESRLAAAQATLEARRADYALTQLQLERHQVRAPFDGMVTQRESNIGEWVSPGDTLLTLVDLVSLRLDFSVPLSAYQRFEGSQLEVRLEGSDEWLSARTVARIPLDASSRQFLLRAVPEKPLEMLPGMAVEGRLQLNGESGPSVPRDALIRRPDGSVSVWIARQNARQDARQEEDTWRAFEQRVEIGSSHQGEVAINEGLSAGDRVIVVGNERLEEGQNVSLSDD